MQLESTRSIDIEKFVPRASSIACAGTCLIISCRWARLASAVKDVTYAIAYADDILADTIYNVERELERKIESEDPV